MDPRGYEESYEVIQNYPVMAQGKASCISYPSAAVTKYLTKVALGKKGLFCFNFEDTVDYEGKALPTGHAAFTVRKQR